MIMIKQKKIFKRKSLVINKKYIKNNIENIVHDINELGNNIETHIDRLIQALKTIPEERTVDDLACIKFFLEESQLANKFKTDNLSKESLDKIFTLCSIQMKYLYLPSNEILFRIGDEPDNFYIILEGKIGILKPIYRKDEMTGIEYFHHIKNLNKNNEKYLLNLTLNKNNDVFEINPDDFENLNLIILKILIEDYLNLLDKNSDTSIEDICELCLLDRNFFGITLDLEQKDDKDYMVSFEKSLYKKVSFVDRDLLQKYRNLSNNYIKWPVTICEYKKFLELGSENFFGDSALDKKTTRNATIQTVTNTHFCYLELVHYSYYLRDEKQKLTMREIDFLVKNFFFQGIINQYFEKKFLNFFVYEEVYKNEIIFRENNPVDYVYFIKEGSCEIYINKNVLEIHDMINYLSELIKHKNIVQSDIRVKNDYFEIQDQFEDIQKIKILYAEIKDTLGAESLYFGLNYIYSAKVSSKICKYYKIGTKELMKIFEEESNCIALYQNESFRKINIIINRLIELNQSKIEMIDKKETINKGYIYGFNKGKGNLYDLEKNRFKIHFEQKSKFFLNKNKKKKNKKNLHYSAFANSRLRKFQNDNNKLNLRLDFTKLNIIRKNINDRRTVDEIMKESIKASGKREFNSKYGANYNNVFTPGAFTVKNEIDILNKLKKEINKESIFARSFNLKKLKIKKKANENLDMNNNIDNKNERKENNKFDNKTGKKGNIKIDKRLEKKEDIKINKKLEKKEENTVDKKNESKKEIKIIPEIKNNENNINFRTISSFHQNNKFFQPFYNDAHGIKKKLLINDAVFDTLKKYSVFEIKNEKSLTDSNYILDSTSPRNLSTRNNVNSNFYTIGSIVSNFNTININMKNNSKNNINNSINSFNRTHTTFSKNFLLSSNSFYKNEKQNYIKPKKKIVTNFLFEKSNVYKRFKQKIQSVDFWYNKNNYMV